MNTAKQPSPLELLRRFLISALPSRGELLAELPFVLLVLGGQLLVLTLQSQTGPLAISDDDYARVVISQQFAEAPKVDPTGSSWLPLPFFLTGTVLWLGDGTLELARAAQWAWALGAGVCLYLAGRVLSMGRLLAAIAALLALSLPYAALLSICTVPEYPTAALIALGLACAGSQRQLAPLLGAASLLAATMCRYEAWPVAGGYGLLMLWQWRSRRSREFLCAAIVSAAFPLAWLGHGIYWHSDALFFVKRVVAYKEALGTPAPQLSEALLGGYLKALVTIEPAPLMLLGVALGGALASGKRNLRPLIAPALLAALLLAVLVTGDLRSGAPTHHAERALLSLWLFASIAAVYLLTQLRTATLALRAGVALLATAAFFGGHQLAHKPSGFVNRSQEEGVGHALRAKRGVVVLATDDYGYFAIQAAAGTPSRFMVLDRHDPRDAKLTGSKEELIHRAAQKSGASWVADNQTLRRP